jgi:hypothetical protein
VVVDRRQRNRVGALVVEAELVLHRISEVGHATRRKGTAVAYGKDGARLIRIGRHLVAT